MNLKTRLLKASLSISLAMFITACAPEIGSAQWCKAMDNKPKGEWTANEVGDYAKHCILP